ncbi:MAG: hypothetical protein AAGB93_19430 [Planctomycetota bacterium]
MPIAPLLLIPLLAAPGDPFQDWHASLADAQEAAAESGRPVLLFQLFGRLDEELC